MDHPLLHEDHIDLRRRVVQFFHNSYTVPRQSDIIFVCGGNSADHLRPQFREYCSVSAPKYQVFQPEFAMDNIFSSGLPEPFDIGNFERLVGELSRAIVIFPEAPGSYAETGYFSTIDSLSKKIVLVMDLNRQRDDSFISLGPAKKINESSIFNPFIQFDYFNPNFELIVSRIDNRAPLSSYRKLLSWKELNELSEYEFFCLVFEIVRFLSVATLSDLEFMLRAMSSAHLSVVRLQQTASILVGAGYLTRHGQFGHLKANREKAELLNVKEGVVQKYNDLGLELASIYLDADLEFVKLIEGL